VDSIAMLIQERTLTGRAIAGLTDAQMLFIPDGHKNNILWNLGHLIVVEQLLHYKLAGRDPYVSNEMIAQFKTGTSPADWPTPPDAGRVRSLLVELPEKLAEDVRNGEDFSGFTAYTTSVGVTLMNFEDADQFNHFHEGVHTGIIMSMRKRLG
jgi:hypothetical protein